MEAYFIYHSKEFHPFSVTVLTSLFIVSIRVYARTEGDVMQFNFSCKQNNFHLLISNEKNSICYLSMKN